MKNLKGKGLLTILLVLALFVSSASMVFADLQSFLVQAEDGRYYEYNSGELNNSYLQFQMDPTNPAADMYEQFLLIGGATRVVALGDSVKGWMDFAAAQNASLAAQIAGVPFVINDFFATPAAPVYAGTVTDPIVVKPDGTTADLEAYNAALADVATKVEADYTADSWANLQTVLAANVMTVANTQVEIDAAVGTIHGAIEALVEVPAVDLAAYDTALAAANAKVEADYTADSWTNLQTVKAANVMTVANTQVEIDAAVGAITEAADALVFENQEDLDNAKLAVADLTEADYTAESWAAIGTALALPETTNAEVGAKALALGTAAADLVFAGQADLDAATAEAATKTEADYTVVTYAPLKTALALPETTNAEVVAKTAAITAAIDALVEVADMAAYDAAVAQAEAVVEADYTAATYAALQTALEENVVTEQDTQAKVDEATAAINAAYDGLELITNVTGVSATDAKTLTVTFNTPLTTADQAKVTFATKRGTVNVSLVPTWAADGKSVALASGANLTAGTYTVTASGIDFGVNTATTTVTARTATSIDIVSDYVTIQDNKTISFVVKDQYGKDMEVVGTATGLSATAYDRTAGTAPNIKGSLTISGVTAKQELKFDNIQSAGFTKDGDEILVTVTYSGVTANKVIVARDVSALASLELGEVQPASGTTRITVNNTLEMPYTAIDQFGDAAKLTAVGTTTLQTQRDLDGWVFTSSKPTIVDVNSFTVDSNGKFTFQSTGTEGTTVITAVNKETGAVTQTTIQTYALARLDTFVMSTPSSIVVAGEKVVVPYTAYDQYGEQILAKDLNTSSVNLNLTTTDNTKASLQWLGKELRINATALTSEVTLTATVPANTNATTNNSKITVEVLAAATPAKITGVKDVSTVLSNNAVSLLKASNLNVLDQYGRAYTLKGTEGAVAYYKASSTAVVLQNQVGTPNTSTVLATGVPLTADSSTGYAKLVGTSTTGNATYVLQLVSNTASPVAITGGTYDLTVQNQSATGITSYAIKPITSLNAATGNNKTTNSVPVTVVGKDAAGNDVALPAGTITTLTVSSPNFGTDIDSGTKAMVLWSTVKGTATLTAWIGANPVATIDITSVENAPVATTATFAKANYVINTPVSTTSTDVKNGLTVKDQFGNTMTPSGTWVSSDTTVATVATDGTVTALTNGLTTITFISANGLSASTVVEIGLTTASTFSGAVQVGGTTGTVTTTSLTLNFSVDPTSLTVDNITVTGADKGILSGTGTTRSLTISNISVNNGETVSVAIASPAGFTIGGSPQTAVVYKDTTAPTAPDIAKLTVNNSGITGIAAAVEGSATVKIFAKDANPASATPVATVTAAADGSFAKQTVALGDYDVYAIDAAGNMSPKTAVTVTAS